MPICSNQLVRRYGVNGSEQEGKTFLLCGPCMVYIKRGGSKLKAVSDMPAEKKQKDKPADVAVDFVKTMIASHKKGMHTPLMIESFLAGMSVIDPKARIKIKVTYPR